MKFLLSIMLASVIGSSIIATAQAHFLPHKKHLTLPERVKYFKHSVWHDRSALKWLRAVKSNFRVMYANSTFIDRKENLGVIDQQLRWHEQALRWHRNLLKFYGEKLHALWLREHPRRVQLPSSSGLPAHYSAWLCIHSHEGSWTDPGSPYYGGLQFGYSEWMRFGYPYTHVTTADQASPLDQMWAAERYYETGAGFYPWPVTARMCGLI